MTRIGNRPKRDRWASPQDGKFRLRAQATTSPNWFVRGELQVRHQASGARVILPSSTLPRPKLPTARPVNFGMRELQPLIMHANFGQGCMWNRIEQNRTHFDTPLPASQAPCLGPSLDFLGFVSRRGHNEVGVGGRRKRHPAMHRLVGRVKIGMKTWVDRSGLHVLVAQRRRRQGRCRSYSIWIWQRW